MRILRWDTALQRALAAAAVAWALLLPLAAFAASRAHAPSVVYAAAASVYILGSAVCHQLPGRSFHLWGVQLPVCARCLGIYAGGAVSAIAALAAGSRDRWRIAPGNAARVALAAAALPTVATLAYEWGTGVMPDHVVRAWSGAPLGALVMWLVVRSSHATAAPSDVADG